MVVSPYLFCTRKPHWCMGGLLYIFAFYFPLHSSFVFAEASPAELKAALVYKFLIYTDWPNAEQAPLKLCVANGNNPVVEAFNRINGRVANGRVIQVDVLVSDSRLSRCDVIYIHNGGAKKILTKIKSSHQQLLTVGDGDQFINDGGVIGLTEQNGQYKFEINMDAVSNNHFKLSAQLLKLAKNQPKG